MSAYSDLSRRALRPGEKRLTLYALVPVAVVYDGTQASLDEAKRDLRQDLGLAVHSRGDTNYQVETGTPKVLP